MIANPYRKIAIALGVATLITTNIAAAGTLVLENFDYGSADNTAINGLNGGTGWPAAWVGNTTPNASFRTNNLSLATTGYTNPTVTNNGALGLVGVNNTGGFTATVNSEVRTAFDLGTSLGTAGTGTVWVSYLVNFSDSAVASTDQLYLYLGGSANNSIRIQGSGGGYVMNGFYNAVSAGTKSLVTGANSGTLLVLAKLDLNTSGNNDSFKLWFNPANLTGGESGLGAADISSAATATFFANSGAANLVFGFRSNSANAAIYLDNLRIAYGFDTSDNSLSAVLSGSAAAVPEPSSYAALAGLSALGLAAIRRRRPVA